MDSPHQQISSYINQTNILEREQQRIIDQIQSYNPSIKINSCLDTQQHQIYQQEQNIKSIQIPSIILNGFDSLKNIQVSMKVFIIPGKTKDDQTKYMNFFINNHLRKLTRKDIVIQFYDHFSFTLNDQQYIVFEMEQVNSQLSLYLLNQDNNDVDKINTILHLIEEPVKYIYDRVGLLQVSKKEGIFPSIDLLKSLSDYFFIIVDKDSSRATIKFDSLNPELFPNDIDISINLDDDNDDQDKIHQIQQINKNQQTSSILQQQSYLFEKQLFILPTKLAIQFIENTNEQMFVFHDKSILMSVLEQQKYEEFELLDYNELTIEFATKKTENKKDIIVRLEKFLTQKESEIAQEFFNQCNKKNREIFIPIYHTQILNAGNVYYLLIEEQRIRRYPLIQLAKDNQLNNDEKSNLFKNNNNNPASIYTNGQKLVVSMSLHYILNNFLNFFSMNDFIPHNNYMIVQLLFLTLQLSNRQEINLTTNDIFLIIQYSEKSKSIILTNIYIRKNINRNILFQDELSLEYNNEEEKIMIQEEILLKNVKSSMLQFSIICNDILRRISKLKHFSTSSQNKFSIGIQEIIKLVQSSKEIYSIRMIKKSQNYIKLKELRGMITLQYLKASYLSNKKHQELFRMTNDKISIYIESYMDGCIEFALYILKTYEKLQIQIYDLSILEKLISSNFSNDRVTYLKIQSPPSIKMSSQESQKIIEFIQCFPSLKSLYLKFFIQEEFPLQQLSILQKLQCVSLDIEETYSEENKNYYSLSSNLTRLLNYKKNLKVINLKINNEAQQINIVNDYWQQFKLIQSYLSSQQQQNSNDNLQIASIKEFEELPMLKLIQQQGVDNLNFDLQTNEFDRLLSFVKDQQKQYQIDQNFINSLQEIQTDYPSIQFEVQQPQSEDEVVKILIKDALNPHFNPLSISILHNHNIKVEKENLQKLKCYQSNQEIFHYKIVNIQLFIVWWKRELEGYFHNKQENLKENYLCLHHYNIQKTLQQLSEQQNLQKIFLSFKICNSVFEQLQQNQLVFDFNNNNKNISLTLQYSFKSNMNSDLPLHQTLRLLSNNLRNNKKITTIEILQSSSNSNKQHKYFQKLLRLVSIKSIYFYNKEVQFD